MTAQPITDLGTRIREHLARRDRAKRAAWFMPGQAAQADARFVIAMVEAAQIYRECFRCDEREEPARRAEPRELPHLRP